VLVRAYRFVNKDLELALGEGRTGDDGRFDLGAFAPGAYRIRLRIPERSFRVPPMILVQPGATPVTVRLRRPEK